MLCVQGVNSFDWDRTSQVTNKCLNMLSIKLLRLVKSPTTTIIEDIVAYEDEVDQEPDSNNNNNQEMNDKHIKHHVTNKKQKTSRFHSSMAENSNDRDSNHDDSNQWIMMGMLTIVMNVVSIAVIPPMLCFAGYYIVVAMILFIRSFKRNNRMSNLGGSRQYRNWP